MGTRKWLAIVFACAISVSSAAFATALPATLPAASQALDAPSDTVHSPPVDAPIVDPFRAPEHQFGPGNRGLEYATSPGQDVTASAAGVVTFAGQVGGNLFVTIDHGNGLRTTVGFVTEILIEAGAQVETGTAIASAGTAVHFSARRNGEYFDPELLFVDVRIAVRLVPGP